MARTKSISILANDLLIPEFNIANTIPQADIDSENYDKNTSLYLELLGVNKIDEEYSAAVQAFQTQLEEQELATKLQANLTADVQANRAVEAMPGLGTGAAAIASAGREHALENVHGEIENTVLENYQSGMQSMAESYLTELERVLGKYDETTGTFTGLSEYQNMANKTTEALMKTLALSLNSSVDTTTNAYLDLLIKQGFVLSDENGTVTLTDAGQEIIDQIVNSATVNEPNKALGNRTFLSVMAEQMAIADYTVDGVSSWHELSGTKQMEILKKYQSWIYNNQNTLRITAWELYSRENDKIIIDTTWSTPDLNSADIYKEGVDIESGISIINLTLDNIESKTESQETLDRIKADISSGKIPNGAYITFSSGKANKKDKFYYVYDGHIYNTEYTMENPPKIIDQNAATVYSFGNFYQTGTGKGKQDKWVQEIIDSAKAGKIPDGTYIFFNYGDRTGKPEGGYYQYSNGKFNMVAYDTKIPAKDKYGKNVMIPLYMADYERLYDLINVNVLYSSLQETDNIEEYLDW